MKYTRTITKITPYILGIVGVFAFAAVSLASSWTATDSVLIAAEGVELPSADEPSGAVWHPRLKKLFTVSDEGYLHMMNSDGSKVETWYVGGDLEGVTVRDPRSNMIEIGREHPDAILSFDLDAGEVDQEWDLTPWMQGVDNQGLEGLTDAGGLFYAAHQENGHVYVFDVSDQGVEHVSTLTGSLTGGTSGLHYSHVTETLYVLNDNQNSIVELTKEGQYKTGYSVPGNDQEGIALLHQCRDGVASMFIAEDAGEVWRYDGISSECTAKRLPGKKRSRR